MVEAKEEVQEIGLVLSSVQCMCALFKGFGDGFGDDLLKDLSFRGPGGIFIVDF